MRNIGFVIVVLVIVIVFGMMLSYVVRPAKAGEMTFPQHQESFHSVGQLDDTTWIKHDDKRHATCYVYYYKQISTSAVGGISCVPDSQLNQP
jgi:hypothetical protein